MPTIPITAEDFKRYKDQGLFNNTTFSKTHNGGNTNNTNNTNNTAKTSVRKIGGCSGCGR
jgi:hypothetical protein